jgi:hypothetical protein
MKSKFSMSWHIFCLTFFSFERLCKCKSFYTMEIIIQMLDIALISIYSNTQQFNPSCLYSHMLLVLFKNLIHKKFCHVLATYHTWKYKIVKIIFYFGYKSSSKQSNFSIIIGLHFDHTLATYIQS